MKPQTAAVFETGGRTHHTVERIEVTGDFISFIEHGEMTTLPSSKIRIVSRIFPDELGFDENWEVELSSKKRLYPDRARPVGNYATLYFKCEGNSREYLFPADRISQMRRVEENDE